jgi:ABC-type multidrug transport system fused ATPase/permease subunit
MFYLLATGIMFPRIVSLLVMEKNENLVEMMRIQGLGLFCYWVGNYIYAFVVILAINIFWLALALGLSVNAVLKVGIPGMIGVLFLWTHAQICISIFLSAIISKPAASGLVSYLFYILSAALAPLVMQTVNLKTGSLPLAQLFVPPFAILSTVSVLTVGKSATALMINILVSLGGSSILGILGCYIHAIRPSPIGIPVDPFFGLFSRKTSTLPPKDVESDARNGDSDVRREAEMVVSKTRSQESDPHEAIRIVNLRKQFKNKLAVDDISLSVKYGEVFGLLGPNGAGKTT